MQATGRDLPRPRRPSPAFVLTDPNVVCPVLQPVIDLETGGVAGYEALARVRRPYPQYTVAELFDWARENARTSELDWVCRCASFRMAINEQIRPPLALLVNAEPAALDTGAPSALLGDVHRARRCLRVIVELTERELAANPMQLFRVVDSIRGLGWEIAVDDVGAEPVSLALLPLLEPDVIKLDRAVIVDPTNVEHARTAVAVAAEAQRTGATIIAEGVETFEQLRVARALGATAAQGFFWGRPSPASRTDLAIAPLPAKRPVRPRHDDRATPPTASILISEQELETLADVVIAAALADPTAVVLAGWPANDVAVRWQRSLRTLAQRCAFAGSLATHDGSREIVMLSPSTSAAITARRTYLPDHWDVAVSYRRDDCITIGQRMIRSVTRVPALAGAHG